MTASQLQKIREALSKALSGEVVELKIIQLSDSGIHIEVILREHPEEENKWFRFAEEMHEESPLRGKSDEILPLGPLGGCLGLAPMLPLLASGRLAAIVAFETMSRGSRM